MARRRMVGTHLYRFDEVGQQLAGKVLAKGTQVIKNEEGSREVGRYEIENEQGKFVINGTDHLDDAFSDVEVFDMVEINYLGSVTTSNGYPVKQFEVYVLDAEADDAQE